MNTDKFRIETEKILSLLKNGDKVTAALSGGADSVCLLLLLNEYCGSRGISLSAIHINHCLRGAESDRDENFCRSLCKRYKIPLTVNKINVKSYCAEKGLSCEEGARELRYRLFELAADGGYIATAHNLNDNAETVLLNLARGTGLKGLCGIPPVRDRIIRPLINIPRSDIEEYLGFKGEAFVTDSTNLEDDFSRNKIRHGVMPVLKDINSGFAENIGNMTEILRAEDNYLTAEAEKLTPDITALKNAPSVIRRRFIMSLLRNADMSTDSGKIFQIERVILKGGREQLSGNIYAYTEKNRLIIGEIPQNGDYSSFCSPLRIGENPIPPDRILYAEKINVNCTRNINKKPTYYALDCDKIQGGIAVRTKKDGDRIKLEGEGFHRRLRKIYNTAKIPVHKREYAVVLEDEKGIIFAEHCGTAARVAPDNDSVNIYAISITDKNS